MNKNLIFSLILITSFNLVISAELEQESKSSKEQTKYEKVLIQFPGIESDLASKNISEENINNSKKFSICGSMIYFEIGDQTISIKKDNEDLTKYKIKIQKTARLMWFS